VIGPVAHWILQGMINSDRRKWQNQKETKKHKFIKEETLMAKSSKKSSFITQI
jgi:hypothetical protein